MLRKKFVVLTVTAQLSKLRNMRKVLVVLMGLVIFLGFSTDIKAESPKTVGNDVKQTSVNSFEMFWPLVAGKTVEDGLVYSLKNVKENIRYALLFKPGEKANYKIFIVVKRMLEGEKLLNEKKFSGAEKSFNKAKSELDKTGDLINESIAVDKQNPLTPETSKRLEDIGMFANWLSTTQTGAPAVLKEIKSEVDSFFSVLHAL
jgi:hypothetical protein